MKKILFLISILSVLEGCVVAPREHVYVPTRVVYESDVIYPEYESSYIWESSVGLFFFVDVYGRRHYMPHGWGYRTHGVPHHRH